MSTHIIRLKPKIWIVMTSTNEFDQSEQLYYGLIKSRERNYDENIDKFNVLFVRNVNNEFPNVKFRHIVIGDHNHNSIIHVDTIGRILVLIKEIGKDDKITTVSHNIPNCMFLESTNTISNKVLDMFHSLINSVEHRRVGVSAQSLRIRK